MQSKNINYILFFAFAVFAAFALSAPAAAVPAGPLHVRNLDTGEEFGFIQAAIYAPNTTARHTIQVDSGTPYIEDVEVNKSVILRGNDTGTGLPLIAPLSGNTAIILQADGAEIHDFNVQVENGSGIRALSDENWIDAVTIDVTGDYQGIDINESDGNKITGCTVNNGTYGLELRNASHNEITDCTFSGAKGAGILISGQPDDTSDYNVISDCTIRDAVWYGISLVSFSAHNEIRDCMISGGVAGINLNGDQGGENHDNVITGCTVNDGYYSLRSFGSSDNTISHCKFIGALYDGIYLGRNSNNNAFTNCTVRDTLGRSHGYMMPNCGIHMEFSAGNTFEDCSITGNGGDGVYVADSTDITFEDCSVTGNEDNGFAIYHCSMITVNQCTASNNNDGIGIYLDTTSFVTLDSCTMVDNDVGTSLVQTDNTIVTGCTISQNNIGIAIAQKYSEGITPNANIANNFFNNDRNVRINYASESVPEPVISWNTIKTSGTSIVDGPYLGGNFWATPDHTGWSETHPDNDGDGIIDEPYVIEGVEVDQEYTDYLPLAYYIQVKAPTNDGSKSQTAAAITSDLSSGENTTLYLDPSNSAFYGIGVTVNGSVDDLLVTARDPGPPGSSIPPPNGTVFQFIEVMLYKTTDDLIEEVEILFTVPLEWLEENGFDPADIVLYRWHDGAWEVLPTTFVKEEDGKAYFSAISPGFSLFAIVAVEQVAVEEEETTVPTSEPTPEPTVEETVTEEPAEPAPTSPAPTPTQSPLLWAPVLALGGIVILLRRR